VNNSDLSEDEQLKFSLMPTNCTACFVTQWRCVLQCHSSAMWLAPYWSCYPARESKYIDKCKNTRT